MPAYGQVEYWNERYRNANAADLPFDWLFSYDDIAPTLKELIPTRRIRLLMVGAGNAPFSSDM